MAKKGKAIEETEPKAAKGRPSSLLDTRVIYCGLRRAQSSRDNLEQLAKLPDACIDLIYISQIRRGGDPPFNSIGNYKLNRSVMQLLSNHVKDWPSNAPHGR